MNSPEIKKITYDHLFESVLGISVCGIVLAALWIVAILVSIEASKTTFFGVSENSLEMQEEGRDGGGGDWMTKQPSSPTRGSSSAVAKTRRVRLSYKLMQLGSVSVLILLTYLLLVVTEAPMWASALGSLCVFGFFLRFQIGDELRRHRIDRIALMMSLFLFIASLMSVCTYAHKSLGNGEIYEGPARIVGYDLSNYNNSNHDPSTRTDLEVQWGKGWGCPKSGGKVCQAVVQGAMCTVNLEDGSRQRRHDRKQRVLQRSSTREMTTSENVEVSNSTETVDEEKDLESENAELEKENEELKKEVEELELANEETEQVAEEEVDEVKKEEEEDEAIYDEDVELITEEELEIEEVYTDAYVEVKEEEIEIQEKNETNPEAIQEEEEEIDELETEKDEVDQIYDEYESEYAESAAASEGRAEDAAAEAEEIEEEEDVTKEQYSEAIEEVQDGEITEEQAETLQDEATETIDEAIEGGTKGENDDDWYWDEITYEYDDDLYTSTYWSYDWESVWGQFACQDLFDEDTMGLTYDTSVPAGTDGYPYINIYGSCKTCEAYILDYFAEQAFESVENHKKMAILYMTAAAGGFLFSFVMYIKHKVNPPADHEIELLGHDRGVLA